MLLPLVSRGATAADALNHLESYEFLQSLIYRRARDASRESNFAWSCRAGLWDILPYQFLLWREKLLGLRVDEQVKCLF